MNIDEHFDRVSRQNLKFQFEFEYCAPFWANQCSCGKMLWPVCRRMMLPCLGDVSVLFRYSWCCFECFGEVSVVWSCLGDVAVTSRCCFSDVLVMFFVMSRFCLGGVSVMSR